jgi:hypothetical protein
MKPHPIIDFVIREVPRQRRRYSDVSTRAGFEKDLLYRWRDGTTSSVKLDTVYRVLLELGYELVPIPISVSQAVAAEEFTEASELQSDRSYMDPYKRLWGDL